MKIGIISVNNAHNFGTSMQAFAFKRYLESQGHDVSIINYRPETTEALYRIVKARPKKHIASRARYCLRFLRQIIKKPYLLSRRKAYEDFFVKHFNLTKPCKTVRDLRMADFDFDIVFAGSDQIWNKRIIHSLDPAFFVDFVGEHTVRASYAASMGKKEISEGEKLVFKNFFRKMDYISVRELSAAESFQPLTDRPIDTVLDPTMLVDREVFDAIKERPPYKQDYIYVHVHHFSAKAPDLQAAAERLSETTGLPIVHNIQTARFKNTLGKELGVGPERTLATIAGATYVITQSFHATVFAILYRKNFITLARKDYSERLLNLMSTLGLEAHYITSDCEIPRFEDIPIDFEKIERQIVSLRKTSIAFIDRALSGGKKARNLGWFDSADEYTCYGCSACYDACPVDAIDMKEDEEGFVRPSIDHAACIECNACKKVCPYYRKTLNSEQARKAFLAYNVDDESRKDASSGGVFGVLCDEVINKGGFVIGVKYNENLQAVYDIADTIEGCAEFRHSKYVEPGHNDIYKKTVKALETGRPVLFSGSPCKLMGLKNYLSREYNNLFLVDIICLNTASPLVFEKYLQSKSKHAQAAVTKVIFRSKARAWAKQATQLMFEDGTVEVTERRWNIYFHCFVSSYLAKYSCFACEFCGDNRVADITIGDYWGWRGFIEYREAVKGLSALKINTSKGEALLGNVSEHLYLKRVEIDDLYRSNHVWPATMVEPRATIIKEIADGGDAIAIMKSYNPRYNKNLSKFRK